ncbi:hypothetical protein AB4Y86_11680 [Arthrobacter sp. 2YAF22_2]
MEHATDETPPRVPAPRHLRRRRFRDDISDLLLVPGAEPYPEPHQPAAGPPTAKRAAEAASPEETTYRRKRLVALILVIAVLISLPALIATLVLAG